MEKVDIEKKIHLALVALIFYIQKGTGTPYVSIVGGDAHLNWTINNLTDDGSRFIRNPADNASLVIFSGNEVIIVDNRTTFTSNIFHGIVSFTLSNVKLSDAGRYTMTNGTNGTNRVILGGQVLIVAVSPNLPVIKALSVAAVGERDYKLICSTESRSAPLDHNLTMHSYWKQNGANISLESRYIVNRTTLTISSLSRKDHDVKVTCQAFEDQRVVSAESREFVLNVLYGPDNVQVTPSGALNVIEGGNMNLTCTAECNPPCSTYNWSKDSLMTIVGSSQSYWIPEVRRNQSGIYNCTVTNTNISKSATSQITVRVHYGPDDGSISLSPNQTFEHVEFSSLSVTCSADCYPFCQYRWTGPGNNSYGNTGLLSIPQIKRDQTGVFTCTATNPEIINKSATANISVTVLYGPDGGIITLFPNQTLERVEFSPLYVNCSADCYPYCQYRWTGPGSYLNGNTGVLSIPQIKRNQTGVFTCTAMNPRIPNRSTTANISVTVFYPPVVSINSQNGTYNNTDIALTCSADGVPRLYVFTLTHSSLFTGIEIRHPRFDFVSTSVISYRFSNFMDTGIYTCTVNNGIADYIDGSMNKSVSQTVWIKGPPNVTSSNTRFYVEKGQSGKLAIEFYNSLLDPNVTWYRVRSQSLEKLDSSDKYNIYISNASVTLKFYSVSIQQPGINAALEIRNVTQDDFGSYQVNVQNSVGVMSSRVLVLQPRGPPDVPYDVRIVPSSITTSSVGVEWLSGFYGGFNQTFAIEYREHTDTRWTKFSEEVFGGMTQYEYFNITVVGLHQETMYLFRVYAWNSYNISEYSVVINATTTAANKGKAMLGNGSDKVIIGSAVGAVVLIGFAVVGGVIIFKRRRMTKLNADGLVDNPVYDSTESPTGFINNSSATRDEYAAVVKPKKKSSEKEAVASLYAQVDKTNNTRKKGTATEKHQKNAKGEIYENVELVGKSSNPENLHENSRSAKARATVDNVYENPETTAPNGPIANRDHSMYADLELNPPTTRNGMPVIFGNENKIEYAEIAYTKRGEPLHESDDERNSDGSKEKIGQ